MEKSKALVILSLILTIQTQSGGVSRTIQNTQDKQSLQMCQDYTYDTINILKTQVTPVKGAEIVSDSAFYISKKDSNHSSGAIWYNELINVENGFVAEFKMSFGEATCQVPKIIEQRNKVNSSSDCFKRCKKDLIYEYCCQVYETEMVEYKGSEKESTNCGGEGIAFVLQTVGVTAIGSAGGGLGYENIYNTFAIEFDSRANTEYNDPISAPNGRHISIIPKKGRAFTNEKDSIAWNDNPVNFNNIRQENFISEANVKIVYLNKQFRVYINGDLQVAFTGKFDFSEFYETHNFFVGFTSSTGTLKQNHLIKDFKLSFPQANPAKSTINSKMTQARVNVPFLVVLQIRDGCGNLYKVQQDNLKVKFNADKCQVKTVQIVQGQIGTIYNGKIVCNDVQSNVNITATINELKTKDTLSIKIVQTGLTKLAFMPNEKYTTETDIVFFVIPQNEAGKTIKTIPEEICQQLIITWPNPAESNTLYQCEQQEDNSNQVTIPSRKYGTYKVYSPLFVDAQDKTYTIQVASGDPWGHTSEFWLSLNTPNGTRVDKDMQIKAGSNVYVHHIISDIGKNYLPLNLINLTRTSIMSCVSALNTTSSTIQSQCQNELTQNLQQFNGHYVHLLDKVQVRGTNQFMVNIRGQPVKSGFSSLKVIPDDWVWTFSYFWMFDNRVNKFYNDFKASTLQFHLEYNLRILFVLRDKFFNWLDTYDPSLFEVTLSGHFMRPLRLCSKQYTSDLVGGVEYTVCPNTEDQQEWDNLVGRSGYILTVKCLNKRCEGQERRFPLLLISKLYDQDAGNGDYELSFTGFSHYSARQFIAGGSALFLVYLRTKNENKRYNRWIPTDQIKLQLSNPAPSDRVTVSRYYAKGTYIIRLYSEVANPNKECQLIVNNQVLTSKKLNVTIFHNQPFKSWVESESLQKGTNSIIQDTNSEVGRTFVVFVQDRFNNTVQFAPSNLDFSLQHPVFQNRFKPEITMIESGKYSIKVDIKIKGNYTFNSVYFQVMPVKQYTLNIDSGIAYAGTSFVDLDMKLQGAVVAGSEYIIFKQQARDRYGNIINPKKLSHDTFQFNGGQNSLDSIVVNSLEELTDDLIIKRFNITRSGLLTIQMAINKENVPCGSCSIQIIPDQPILKNTGLFLLKDRQWTQIQSTLKPTISVKDKFNPVFFIQLQDKYNNKHKEVSKYELFNLTLQKPDVPFSIIFDERSINGGIEFTLRNSRIPRKTTKQLDFLGKLVSGPAKIVLQAKNKLNNALEEVVYDVDIFGLPEREATSSDIDIKITDFTPIPAKARAGQWGQVKLNLRDSKNKLLNFWYPEHTGLIKVIEDTKNKTNNVDEWNVEKGPIQGTYLINFKKEKTGLIDLQFAVNIEEGQGLQNVLIKPKILIQPNIPEKVVFNTNSISSVLPPISIDNPLTVSLKIKDKYNNVIPNLTPLDARVNILHNKDTNDVKLCSLSSGANANNVDLEFKVTCTQNGQLTIKSALPIQNEQGQAIPEYTVQLTPGQVDPSKSLITANVTKVLPNEPIEVRVYPRDKYQNPIDFAEAKLTAQNFNLYKINHQAKNKDEISQLQDATKGIQEGKFVTWTVKETKASEYKLLGQLNGEIIGRSPIVQVQPAEGKFTEGQLLKLNSDDNLYQKYNSTAPWIQKLSEYPIFKYFIQDSFGNVYQDMPAAIGQVDVYLYLEESLNDKNTQPKPILKFCLKNNEYHICSTDYQQYKILTSNTTYVAKVQATSGNKDYRLILVGGNSSEENSRYKPLPVNIQNTVVTPSDKIETTSGKDEKILIELKTIDPQYRKAVFWQTPSEYIKLEFEQDSANNTACQYNIANGDSPGRFIATVNCKKAYSSKEPQKVFIHIAEEDKNNKIKIQKPVEFTVRPVEYSYAYIVNPNTVEAQKPTLSSQTVDEVYKFNVAAWDKYGNRLKLSENLDKIPVKIVSPEGKTIDFKTDITANNLATVEFQPFKKGIYKIKVGNQEYQATIEVGAPHKKYSFATLNKNVTNAGELAKLTIKPYDQYGNEVIVNKTIKSLFQAYQVKNNEKQLLNADSGDSILSFTINQTQSGDFNYIPQLNQADISCQLCSLRVIPASPIITNTEIYYSDPITSKYEVIPATGILEDNKYQLPKYQLKFKDSFNNTIKTPIDPKTLEKAKLVLFGNGITQDKGISFKLTPADHLINAEVPKASIGQYNSTPGRKEPYTLKYIDVNGKNLQWPIFLQGNGESDLTASISPIDLSKTLIDPKEVVIRAGEFGDIQLELRAEDGLRKLFGEDEKVAEQLTVQFNVSDGVTKASVREGDKKGRLIVTLTSTKAYSKQTPVQVSMKLNNSDIPQKVNLIVLPSDIKKVKIDSDQNKKGNADENYVINVQAFDQYDNLCTEYFPAQLGVKFEAENKKSDFPIQALKDLTNTKTTYNIKTTLAGIYYINSPFLNNSNLHNFTVSAGKPDATNSEFIVSNTSINAGQLVGYRLILRDQYNNTIPPTDELIKLTQSKLYGTIVAQESTKDIDLEFQKNPFYPDSLTGQINLTKKGIASFRPQVNQVKIQCTNCSVNVESTELSLRNSKLKEITGPGTFVYTDKIRLEYPTILQTELSPFDKYDNRIESLGPADAFNATLSGNNLPQIPLDVVKQGDKLIIKPSENNIPKFSRIVPSDKLYDLKVDYIKDGNVQQTKLYKLNITGDTNEAGNGEISVEHTLITEQVLRLIAGKPQTFTVEIRTNESKRYNLNISASDIQVIEEPLNSQPKLISVAVTDGKQRSIFDVTVNSTKAIPYVQEKWLRIKVGQQTVERRIKVFIQPDEPDWTKTQFIIPFPEEVESEQYYTIRFKLYDQYNNQYTNSSISDKLSINLVKGNATYNKFSMYQDQYQVTVRPMYPPRFLEFTLNYIKSDSVINTADIQKDLIKEAQKSNKLVNTDTNNNNLIRDSIVIHKGFLKAQVSSKFDSAKTQVQSPFLNQLNIGDQPYYTVLLKNENGECYEGDKEVSVRLSGPYSDFNLSSNQLDRSLGKKPIDKTTRAEKVNLNIGGQQYNEQGDYLCTRLYSAAFDRTLVKSVGIYQVDVLIEGEQKNPVRTLRQTEVKAGKFDVTKTIVTLLAQPGRGNSPVILTVGDSFEFNLVLRDINGNPAQYDPNVKLSLEISGLKLNQDYFLQEGYPFDYGNGSYALKFNTTKDAEYSNFVIITINDIKLSYSQLTKIDGPEQIIYKPSKCDRAYPNVQYQKQDKILVGDLQTFTVQCKDKLGNLVREGGDNFVSQIIGDSDIINTKVVDMKNGQYQFEYVIIWAGKYKVNVLLDGLQYSNFPVNADQTVCSIETPYECPNNKKCAKDEWGCQIDILTPKPNIVYNAKCQDKTKFPFYCQQAGTETCVTRITDCDAPTNYVYCPTQDKLVLNDTQSIQDICAFKADGECPNRLVRCPSGECRKNLQNCPNKPSCPLGYKLCGDLTCALLENQCPQFQKCQDGFYKCPDQTCVRNLNSCPTRKTCKNENDIVCPDLTCATNELYCKKPRKCLSGLITCPGQSCSKSYADCPTRKTCEPGYALCEDGTCLVDCKSSVQGTLTFQSDDEILPFQARLLQNEDTKNETKQEVKKDNQVVCPGGEKAHSYFICPTIDICPVGYVRCEDGSCAERYSKCLLAKCPNKQCWDGTCVNDLQNCPSRTTCNLDTPIKCPDGSCVSKKDECPKFIACPPYAPTRCANGACSKSHEECPTITTCPKELPILCPDGSCQRTPYKCGQTEKCQSGTIRCPNGQCAQSILLCPTDKTCAPGMIKCWNRKCAKSLAECEPVQTFQRNCPKGLEKQCPDGSCRASLDDCPTELVCPLQRPVRCDDGTCKEARTQCIHSECSADFIKCPDGTCTRSHCSTPITCSKTSPYKCYDNTCRSNPLDCPDVPVCRSDAPILCPDGSCQTTRALCRINLDACPAEKPVRCPDFNCYQSAQQCVEIKGCPPGLVRCNEDSCMLHESLCQPKVCPLHLSVKCKDGFCVSDKKYCSNEANGCPYNKQHKCENGLCVDNQLLCPKTQCDGVKCLDGSCVKSKDQCFNNVFGCPDHTSYRCANGLCINLEKDQCPIATCPKEQPIKCDDGICVTSRQYCRARIGQEEAIQCQGQADPVPCADGTCVQSSEQCRPIYACSGNMARCQDGSCRPLASQCPQANSTCPGNQIRCESGVCAVNKESCSNDYGCPNYSPQRCKTTGHCVRNSTECEQLTALLLDKQVACDSKNQTCPITQKCQDGQYECQDGRCVAAATECSIIKKDKFTCPDGSYAPEASLCYTNEGCPMTQPFRCPDGTCKKLPLAINENDTSGCQPQVICPVYKPYKCADGECVGDTKFCKAFHPCPQNEFNCGNGFCSVNKVCAKSQYCPIASPILCPSGKCVQFVSECSVTEKTVCDSNRPIRCVSGYCVSHASQCIEENTRVLYLGKTQKKSASARILQSTTPGVDAGCSQDTPFRCTDGSCRKVGECPTISGCFDPKKPYRCSSGSCVSSVLDCSQQPEHIAECEKGKRCEDGLCREKCPAFYGCPLSRPLHCPNGYCAKVISECAGESRCTHNLPYRCSNGECVAHPSLCKRSIKNTFMNNVVISINPSETVTYELEDSESNVDYGKIIIPAGAFATSDNKQEQQNVQKTIILSSVPDSEINGAVYEMNKKQWTRSQLVFPGTGLKLAHHQVVRSPIVKVDSIEIDNNSKYKFPLVLSLNTEIPIGASKESLCLGTVDINNKQWKCTDNQYLGEQDQKMAYNVQKDGIYAVIYNPESTERQFQNDQDWFVKYWKIIAISLVLGITLLLAVGYVLWRVIRYVGKYRAKKQEKFKLKEEINVLRETETGVIGQTLGDKVEGISFAANPFANANRTAESDEINNLENEIKVLTREGDILEATNKNFQDHNQDLAAEIEKLKADISRLRNSGINYELQNV